MSEGKARRHGVLYRTLFADLLFDRWTRPIMIYMACLIAMGAGGHHELDGGCGLGSIYCAVITQ